MRKLTVLSLAGLLILAFSAIGYAQAPKLDFRASGFIDVQTFIGEGVPQYNSNATSPAGLFYGVTNPNYSTAGVGINVKANGWNKTDSHWESRAHLKFDAVMGPNLSGTIYFEIDTFRYGSTFNIAGAQREANGFGAWTTDRTAVEVKNIYIDVGLPYFGIPVPITVRVGAQPIGVRPNMMVYSDGTGVTAGIKLDPVMIMPIYAKALENLDFADDDVDVWGVHANAKISTFTVGAYGLLYRMNTYPLFVVDTGNVIFPGSSLQQFAQNPGTFKSHMWWLGAYVDGKAGPVNLNFDFVYDYGSVDERTLRGQGAGFLTAFKNFPNVKYEGWATRLKADFPWEKFNFGMVGMYATGPDARRTSQTGLPGSTVGSGLPGVVPGPGFQLATSVQPNGATNLTRRVTGYVVPPGSEQGPSTGESMVVYSMEPGATGGYGIANNANYGGLSRGGFGGTWFAKLYASMKLAPWYKLTLQGLYIGDTTKNGDTFGNSVKYIQCPITSNGGTAPMMLRDNNNIGWEFDILNEIQIYNNLRLFVGGGYLFAGDALDVAMQHRGGIPGAPGSDNTGMLPGTIVGNRRADNPWAVRTRLMYTF